jgi:hypothetical protein
MGEFHIGGFIKLNPTTAEKFLVICEILLSALLIYSRWV